MTHTQVIQKKKKKGSTYKDYSDSAQIQCGKRQGHQYGLNISSHKPINWFNVSVKPIKTTEISQEFILV